MQNFPPKGAWPRSRDP